MQVKEILLKQCLECGNKYSSTIKRQKYCSYRCGVLVEMARKSKKPKYKTCKHCSSEFTPYTSLDKFCSMGCRINNQKSKRSFNWKPDQVAKRVGENNPSFRSGMYARSTKRNATGYKKFFKNRDEIKQAMIDSVGFVHCEHCKTTNTFQFEAHHIIYRSDKPGHEHLNDKPNILILCMQCHNDFHKTKGMRNSLVIERGLNILFGNDVLDK